MKVSIVHIIIFLILLFILVLISAGIYFYRLAVSRRKKDFLKNNPDLIEGNLDNPWASGREWLDNQECENLTISSYDGLTLHAYYIAAPSPSSITAVLIHGYTGRGRDMAAIAKYYHEDHGFNVLMPDCRGHGESEGDYIGFGWHDRFDILRWLDYIIDYSNKEIGEKIKKNVGKTKDTVDKFENEVKIIIHGVSMGAATALMTGGEKLPENVKLIISDCAYTSVKDILSYQLQRMFKLPKFPLIQITSLICKLRAGYFFGEASALAQVRKAGVPILFIHGNEDKFVPTEMVYKLYEAASCEKQLFIVDEASHGNSFWTDMEGYKKQVEEFLGRYIV